VQEDAVGTSLRRAWLKEASSGIVSQPDFSQAAEAVSAPAMAALERASTQVQAPSTQSETPEPVSVRIRSAEEPAHLPVLEALEEALKPVSSPNHSVPDLAALAELHRGGDPEDLLRRDAQRRAVITVAVIATVIFGTAFAILVGTGVIVF
jgi:hypothetical protein